jgi:hypothetical protein
VQSARRGQWPLFVAAVKLALPTQDFTSSSTAPTGVRVLSHSQQKLPLANISKICMDCSQGPRKGQNHFGKIKPPVRFEQDACPWSLIPPANGNSLQGPLCLEEPCHTAWHLEALHHKLLPSWVLSPQHSLIEQRQSP